MGLPENVYRLRVTDGHSVEQVSEATKVPVPVLSAIENGRVNVPPRVLKALSTHFGIPVRDLLK